METTRRELLKVASVAGALSAVGSAERIVFAATDNPTPLATPRSTREGDMLYRVLGRTGQRVSLIGLGGRIPAGLSLLAVFR